MTKVTNEEVLAEVIKAKETGEVTETLGKIMTYVANRYAERQSYVSIDSPLKEDAIQEAIAQMVKGYSSFCPEKSNNAMAFLCQIAGCSFANVIGKEHKQRHIVKDATDAGENI